MKVRIQKEEPTPIQKRALEREATRQFLSLIDKYNRDAIIMMCNTLYFKFNFTEEQLKEFCREFTNVQKERQERYDMPEADVPWLCEIQLRDEGINIEELLHCG